MPNPHAGVGRVGLLAAALSLALVSPALPAGPADAVAHPDLWPAAHSPAAITDPATEQAITELMARMSVEEKVGQTVQADIGSIRPEDLRTYPLGSILAGGNSGPNGDDRAPAPAWVKLAADFRAVSMEARPGHTPIPVIFGVDAVHGHNNIIGATIFPHNVGLGAARDPELVRRIGAATAEEVAATGVDWTFGPTVAVPRDWRWGRSYEGYGEDPEIVRSYAGQMTLGLQGELTPGRPLDPAHVAGSAKHFLGDGATTGGKDQGDAAIPESELIAIHAQGYPPAIDAGVLTVMTSFSSWNGAKHSANRSLITDVLKGRMGFEGFVVDDWNAHGQVAGCSNTDCPQAMIAGLDMYMAPDSWRELYGNLLREVRRGQISMARLDDAVRRILRVKFKLGLFAGPRPLAGQLDRLGTPAHRALAREAVRRSLVLLKNDGVLPLKPSARVLVAGEAADDIGRQSGGWTISWQGTGNTNADFPGGHSIWGGIAAAVKAAGGEAELAPDGRFAHRPDVAIVVFGETPYAEFQGDLPSLEYQPGDKRDLALLKRLRSQGIPVVSVFLSGRPLWTNPEINASNAFVAAWLPGSQGEGVADVLFRRPDGAVAYDFTGRLPVSWPRLAAATPTHRGDAGYAPQFPYGYGLSYAHAAPVAQLDENPGPTPPALNVERFFVAGHTPEPWRFAASGGVNLAAADDGAQENVRQATWTGPGRLAIGGATVDLSRQTTGDMALYLRYRVVRPAGSDVRLAITCGAGCGAGLEAGSLFSGADTGWRTARVKLSCFRDAGAVMTRVTEPLVIETRGPLTVRLQEARLVSNTGDASCPRS
ncbi:MAG: exo 1,3/1,4-beta-D-glucan glucohydrolase [Caulobacterales bacterium]|nr:exo 1,3/1,4-beta-D-glucan glucohydrolase [Caulobacterales bacterium]